MNFKKKPSYLREFCRYGAGSPLTGFVSVSLVALAGVTAPAIAAEEDDITLDAITVMEQKPDTNPYAEEEAPYKAKYSGDERHKRELAKTPQNITVLTGQQIQDSGYTDLREILDAQPGITIGTGENGNAFGDRYIIRGQEARSDVFVDGLRDPGMTLRESFATEQVEITKGPNSSFAGRGTAGGAVNSISKQAHPVFDFTTLSTGFGTDKHTRLTLDTNQVLTDNAAVRANILYGYEEVPDRAPADRERKGVALSGLYAPTNNVDLIVDYYGLRAEDTPDLGGFLVGEVPHRKPAKDVPVYLQEQDFMESDVDIFTARLQFDVSRDVYITNATRKGMADNGYVATGARATSTHATDPNGVYETISLSTHQGWQEVDYLANQTNVHWDVDFGDKEHNFIFGLELTQHKVLNGVYEVENSGSNCIVSGRSGPSPGWCVMDEDGNEVNGLNTLMNRQISKSNWDQDWQVKSTSVYIMDTVDITDQWTVFAGLRHDKSDLELVTRDSSGVETGDFEESEGVWNGHLGASYQFRPDANVYFNFAQSSDINGGESDVGTNSGYGGFLVEENVSPDPERSTLMELGSKWNVMGGKMLATAAVFQITKDDVMEGNGYEEEGTANSGKNQVQGIEFGVVGNITDRLTGQAGVAFMEAEVLESATAENEGKTLSNFADKSAFLQLKYQTTRQLALGAAAKYESEKYAGQPDAAAGYTADGDYSQPIPAYTVVDLFANYRFNADLDMRVNIGNVFDKDYYTAGYRSGSFLYKGDARNLRVTLNYDF